MVVTMLEARVPEENAAGLIDRFGGVGDALPPFIVESFLIHAAGSGPVENPDGLGEPGRP